MENNQNTNIVNQQYNNQGVENSPNNFQANTPKNSNNNKKIIIIAVVAVLVVALVAFSLGSVLSKNNKKEPNFQEQDKDSNEENHSASDSDDRELPLYATISSKELANSVSTDNYKEYINKKITITDLIVSAGEDKNFIHSPGFTYFYVSCENEDSLEIQDGDKISITGIVKDDIFTNSANFIMKNCSVSK